MSEFQQLQAALALLETEIANCNLKEREAIDKAREFNGLSRAARLERTGIEEKAAPIRKRLSEIAARLKREATEKAKAEAEAAALERERLAAEARAKKEEEAKAKAEADRKALETEEIEKLKARIAELEGK